MKVTKNILIFVLTFLAVLEIIALIFPDISVISHVAKHYKTQVFSIPFAISMIIIHLWVTLLKKATWQYFVWIPISLGVLYVDFFTAWEPSDAGYVVFAGLLTGIFWPQRKSK